MRNLRIVAGVLLMSWACRYAAAQADPLTQGTAASADLVKKMKKAATSAPGRAPSVPAAAFQALSGDKTPYVKLKELYESHYAVPAALADFELPRDCAESPSENNDTVYNSNWYILYQKVIPGHGPVFEEQRFPFKIMPTPNGGREDAVYDYTTNELTPEPTPTDFVMRYSEPDHIATAYFRKNGNFIVFLYKDKYHSADYGYCYKK